jgi:hypothetical protein
MSRYPQVSAGLLSIPPREFIASASCSATCTLQTRDEVLDGAFFLLVSKGFSDAIRLSETGDVAEIGL